MAIKPVSVTQLNGYLKRILSSDPILMNLSVVGEISNLTKHSSGHWYFSLKDDNSSIRCFLPYDRVANLRFDLEEGMSIVAYGSISVYEKGGSYSLLIRDIDVKGEGDLKKAFELLMKKLSEEGLFDEDHKKEIPEFPKKIGVVTSPTGAAIKDIISTIKRRNPLVDIRLYPALVQGDGASKSIIEGIEYFNKSKEKFDLLIVGRGGGSAEDLWAFNEEALAREIYMSNIPIISAVGHEIDYVISDYVADLRAATPTAAAELAVPDIEYYKDIIRMSSPINLFNMLLDRVESQELHIKHLKEMCDSSIVSLLNSSANRLKLLESEIKGYNPLNQLEKGYAVVKDSNDKWVVSKSKVKANDKISVILKDGSLECLVLKKQ